MQDTRSLSSFDPAKIARYETDNWVAYYRKQWFKLLRISVGMVREAFRLSLPQALHGAYLVARAEIAAAPAGNDIPLAESYMRRFYQMVKDTHRATYDVGRAAHLEVNWWVVHRRLFGQAENAPLVDALADLYAETYQVEQARVRDAAWHRAQAMVFSDRWVNEGCAERSPLLNEVEAELFKSYASLRAATETG